MMSTKLVSQQINHLILVQDCLAQIESRLKLLKDCSNKVNWSFAYSWQFHAYFQSKTFVISKKLLGWGICLHPCVMQFFSSFCLTLSNYLLSGIQSTQLFAKHCLACQIIHSSGSFLSFWCIYRLVFDHWS